MKAFHHLFILMLFFGVCCACRSQPLDGDLQGTLGAALAKQIIYTIKPSEADPAITEFDSPNTVVENRNIDKNAQLVVFLPGSDGAPDRTGLLQQIVANQGYRVIGLMYDNTPAVIQVCPRNPDPASSGLFREERIFGDAPNAPVQNSPEESITHRLVMLLRYLDRVHPNEGWGNYLSGDQPNWSRIVISGLSQGAGMAAYIAQRKPVARVVLFSSPWDFLQSGKLAPWIYGPSVTPPDRWFAEYHRRENTAALLAQSYHALRIPDNHVLIFDLDIPDTSQNRKNPYHGSTVRLSGYIPQWQLLYGVSP